MGFDTNLPQGFENLEVKLEEIVDLVKDYYGLKSPVVSFDRIMPHQKETDAVRLQETIALTNSSEIREGIYTGYGIALPLSVSEELEQNPTPQYLLSELQSTIQFPFRPDSGAKYSPTAILKVEEVEPGTKAIYLVVKVPIYSDQMEGSIYALQPENNDNYTKKMIEEIQKGFRRLNKEA